MTRTNHLLSIACATVLTMTILLGIDHLARHGARGADAAQMAQTPDTPSRGAGSAGS